MKKAIEKMIRESSEIVESVITLSVEIEKAIKIISSCIKNGNKIIIFGNGGSAADAQHIAAEFMGRYKLERPSFPAISLTTDTSIITAISNDYSFDTVFSRQCEGLVSKGDVVIGISTSGNSVNVKKALSTARKKSAKTIGLLGDGGGKIKKIVDIPIVINSSSTPRIQEAHRTIYHIICELVEINLTKEKKGRKNGRKNT